MHFRGCQNLAGTLQGCLAFLIASLLSTSILHGFTQLDNLRLTNHPGNDGDSFEVTDGERTWHFRLYFVDTTETAADSDSMARRVREQTRYFGLEDHLRTIHFGHLATAFTREKLSRPFTVHTVFADAMGRTRGGRSYAFVTTADGEDLAELLVRHGLARSFGVGRETPAGISREEQKQLLDDLEVEAILTRRGIWAEANADRIVEFRRQERAENAELQRIRKASTRHDPETEGLLPLNSASAEALVRLPGVGPVLAGRIIAARPFGQVEDLLGIDGVGPATYSRLIDFVSVDDDTDPSGNGIP